jgi:hypothetical protein
MLLLLWGAGSAVSVSGTLGGAQGTLVAARNSGTVVDRRNSATVTPRRNSATIERVGVS